jgi:hypothetical protein
LGEALEAVADFFGGEAGEDDDGELGAVGLDVGEDVEAVDVGHLEVEEEEVVCTALDEAEGCGAVGGFVDLVAVSSEEAAEGGALGGGVVDHEEAECGLFGLIPLDVD